MKERVQIILIHIAVGLILFISALVFFDYRISLVKGSPSAELAAATYPVMEVSSESGDYNLMKAYNGEIDLSLVRNQISILDDSGTLSLKLYCYDYDITAIQYSLFQDAPSSPVEEGTVNRLTDQTADRTRTGSIQFNSDLREGENYFLKMAVRLDNATQVWFYTRLQTGHSHYEDYLSFARDFHNTLLEKEGAQEKIGVYLETDANDNSYSLEHVDIHSNFRSVIYGNIEVKEEKEPAFRIREINDTYAVVDLMTVLSAELADGTVQYYDVKEIYKLKYNPERMFLLDYQRYMDARYNPKFIDSSDNDIGLGIQAADNVQYLSSEDGYRAAFAVGGQLWDYEYKTSNVARVYSFSSENVADLRNDPEEHGIRILDMDDEGNLLYLVYGYMSRGRHEGANGIQIIRYDAETACNEELAFLVTALPYEGMKEDLSRLSYLNSKGVFYCLLDGDLHEIDLKNKSDKILLSGLQGESLTASRDHSIIAVEKKQNLSENSQIDVISLEDGETRSYSCGKGKRIRSVGFLNRDFIYGAGKAADIRKAESGAVIFPASTLYIVNTDGKLVRKYRKKNRFITGTTISGSVLSMQFAKRKGNTFEETDDKDYIRYKDEETNPVNLSARRSETFGEQLYLSFPDYVYIQVAPDLVLTRFKTSEDDNRLKLKRTNENADQYYVYADGEKVKTTDNLPDAVMEASELRGNVFDDREKIIWECAFDEYNIVPGMDHVIKVKSDRLSLAGSLAMIAAVNGKKMTADEIDRKPGTPAALLNLCTGYKTLTLTGCSLDDVLYYISKGSPVLAKYSDTRYVVIMSYNSGKIRYLDPVTGKSTVENRVQITESLKKQGNIFYSYLAD